MRGVGTLLGPQHERRQRGPLEPFGLLRCGRIQLDVIPLFMQTSRFGVAAALHLAAISYRQLDYWAKTGLVSPSIREANGRGSRRVYSFLDLVALRVVAQLLAPVSPPEGP